MIGLCLSPVLRQYLVIITANLSCITLGIHVAWSSPVLVKLKDDTQTVLSRPITEEEGSWLVSVGPLSGLILYYTIGFVMNRIGRKNCILLGFIPRLVACLLLMFGKEVWALILGRAIDGFGNVIAMSVVPTYASEIAGKECRGALGTTSQVASAVGMLFIFGIGPFMPYFELNLIYICIVTVTCIPMWFIPETPYYFYSKECRGALGTTSQVASAVGMLFIFGIGPFMPYFELNLIYICIVTVTCIPMWFIPETPYYFYSKGRKDDALQVLTYLRGSETVAMEEIKQYSLNHSKNLSTREIFKDKTTLKTLGKVILLSMLLELIGYNAVILYMQTVLQWTHTSVREEIASLVNGCIQLLACFCTILLTDRFGRKPILISTLLGMGIGMLGMGTFFKLKQDGVEIIGFLNYLPLLSMMLIIFCFNAGMGSIFWIVVAELFDGPARAIGVSTGSGVANAFIFFTCKYFAYVTHAIGAANIYWIFSCNCVITAIFMMLFIPETKGKTFAEIQAELGSKSNTTLKTAEKTSL